MPNTTTINAPLNDYVNVHKDELIVKASATFATLPYIDKMYGVKYQDVVPMLESSVVLKDGSSCGWDPNGADTISPVITTLSRFPTFSASISALISCCNAISRSSLLCFTSSGTSSS